MAVDHRSCKDIFDIPEFVQNNKAHTDSKEIQEEIKTAKRDLIETLGKCKGERDRLLKCKEEALHAVQDFRKEIDKRLDILEQNSIDSIEKKYKSIIDKINDEIQLLENTQIEVVCAKTN
ncbi:uncharacterized protein LOC123532186 isoform X2 [Mercenaria mercenaria]|uniref:uncharacterized protein LOC123532186 isoform X2 n=1 Tax=Mercenaria mercenaria TaxID=6596 RepID=UPI00234F819A|nr:uncharacterized protein LOC123532186 isoform X2 [Mercenaria mercenaria]